MNGILVSFGFALVFSLVALRKKRLPPLMALYFALMVPTGIMTLWTQHLPWGWQLFVSVVMALCVVAAVKTRYQGGRTA